MAGSVAEIREATGHDLRKMPGEVAYECAVCKTVVDDIIGMVRVVDAASAKAFMGPCLATGSDTRH